MWSSQLRLACPHSCQVGRQGTLPQRHHDQSLYHWQAILCFCCHVSVALIVWPLSGSACVSNWFHFSLADPRAFEEAAGIEDTDQDVDNAMLQQGQHVYPGTTTHHATPPHNQAHPVQQYADDNRPHPADHVHAHAQQQDSSLFHTQQGPARGFKSGPGPVGEGVEPPGSSDATDTSALVQNPLFANRTALTTSTSLPRISPAPSAHISPALPAGYAAPAVSSEGRLPASGEAAVAGGGGADHHPHLRSSLRSLAPSLPHWHSLASSADPSNHPSTVAAPAGRGLTAMHGSTVVRGSVHALPGDHSTMAAAGQVISGVAAHRGRALLAGPSPAAARGMEIKLQVGRGGGGIM
jgi:hypothetical protein